MKILIALALVVALYSALWLITSPIRLYQLMTMIFSNREELDEPAIILPPAGI